MNLKDRDKRLLLRAALNEPQDAIRYFKRWCATNTIYDAPHNASRLFPLIHQNIGSLIDDKQTAERLRGFARHTWLANNLRVRLCLQALERLAKAEIPTLLLKGAAMASVVTGDYTVRQMGDCDILVPHDRAKDAVDCLLTAGLYSIPFDVRRFSEFHFREFHGATFRNSDAEVDVIDLHWRPLREVGCPQLTSDFFASARPAKFAGHAALGPSPETIFFHIAMHGSEWAPEDRFDWFADLAIILRRFENSFDWSTVTNLAAKFGCGRILYQALRRALSMIEIPVPGEVFQKLGRRSDFFQRYEARKRMSGGPRSELGKTILTLQKYRRSGLPLIRLPLSKAVPAILRERLDTESEKRAPSGAGLYEVDFVHGWHSAEVGGRWSDGRYAFIRLPNDPKAEREKLLFRFHVIDLYADTIDIFIGRHMVKRISWRKKGPRFHALLLDIPRSERGKHCLRIFFRLRRPRSPAALWGAKDARTLGIFLHDIRTLGAPRDIASAPIDFRTDEEVVWTGWSFPEDAGRWTDGEEAIIRWTSTKDIPANSLLKLAIAGHFGQPTLTGDVSLNGTTLGALDLRTPSSEQEILLPVPIRIAAKEEIEIRIRIDRPRSPEELGLSSDSRKLGLLVRTLKLEPVLSGHAPARSAALTN